MSLRLEALWIGTCHCRDGRCSGRCTWPSSRPTQLQSRQGPGEGSQGGTGTTEASREPAFNFPKPVLEVVLCQGCVRQLTDQGSTTATRVPELICSQDVTAFFKPADGCRIRTHSENIGVTGIEGVS